MKLNSGLSPTGKMDNESPAVAVGGGGGRENHLRWSLKGVGWGGVQPPLPTGKLALRLSAKLGRGGDKEHQCGCHGDGILIVSLITAGFHCPRFFYCFIFLPYFV